MYFVIASCGDRPHSLYYDDFKLGETFRSSRSRQVTQQEINEFAELTGDLNKIHVDVIYAKGSIFGGIIAHGLLTLSSALGLWYELDLTRDSIVAFMGIDHLTFKAPVRPGDTIRLESRVSSKRESSSKKDRGLVTFSDMILNQEGTVVLQFERTLLLKKQAESSRI